jgi:hypothetical protein
MPRLEVFDPPMCCSTGVCGPNVDPVLPRFAADLDWLRAQGVDVIRHNLAQQTADFLANPLVKQTLTEQGETCLPLVLLDGRIIAQGVYPTRQTLADAVVAAANPGRAGAGTEPPKASNVIPVRRKSCCG